MNKDLAKRNIAVLYGGTSSEREVSLRSGSAVYEAILHKGYNTKLIDAAGDLCKELRDNNIDLAFIALHGGVGENGAIQGFLEVLGIPYTGSGILASALAMDKERSKTRFISDKIDVPPYVVLNKWKVMRGNELDTALINNCIDFKFPWVVKPASEGSSIGVNIIHNESEVDSAVREAFYYEDRLIIEKYIRGKEIQIAILCETPIGGVEVRPSTEFYSYEAKYTAGMTRYIIPPDIQQTDYERLKQMALRAHKALGCRGATRVDLILSEDGIPYVLEVNTIPGMTATSLLPKIADSVGISFGNLVEQILLQSIDPSLSNLESASETG